MKSQNISISTATNQGTT